MVGTVVAGAGTADDVGAGAGVDVGRDSRSSDSRESSREVDDGRGTAEADGDETATEGRGDGVDLYDAAVDAGVDAGVVAGAVSVTPEDAFLTTFQSKTLFVTVVTDTKTVSTDPSLRWTVTAHASRPSWVVRCTVVDVASPCAA
jgi:hypothetical protein